MTDEEFNTQANFAMANRGNLDVMVWYGWNEYYERTQIEPSYRVNLSPPPDEWRIYNWVKNFNTQWKQ